MRYLLTLVCLSLALVAFRANAEEVACLTSIGGDRRALVYDPEEPNVRANISIREKTFGGPDAIECPGFVTLTAILNDMTPGVTYAQMEPFCLQYDPGQETYSGVAVGRRNSHLICKEPGKSLCQHVIATKDSALAIAGLGTGVASGVEAAATAAGVSAITSGSGAVILTGPASYLSGAFASLGASALSVLTAPATLTATAVTVVVVGSAVYACRE